MRQIRLRVNANKEEYIQKINEGTQKVGRSKFFRDAIKKINSLSIEEVKDLKPKKREQMIGFSLDTKEYAKLKERAAKSKISMAKLLEIVITEE